MIHKKKRLPDGPVLILLLASLCITLGRGMTLPFMTIYLNRQYAMSVDKVGLAMTFALVIGVAFSLTFGMLADRFDKKRYMLIATGCFITGFIGIPLSHSPWMTVAFYAVINCSYSVFASVLKGYFSDTLPPGRRPGIFSLNYTFINIGWTIGPPLGTMVMLYSVHLPFWLAALCASLPFVLIGLRVPAQPPAYRASNEMAGTDEKTPASWSLSVLLHDKALGYFTLSGFLSSLVCGSFVSFLSQYVLVVADNALAEKVVSVVLPINALVVVSFQYWVGKQLRPSRLKGWMFIGSVCFSLGLLGFLYAGNNLVVWGVAAVIFTFGELIYVPGEYMLIDHIAPPGMKASYFSAQNIGNLGAAANPLVTGYMLTWFPAPVLFCAFIVAICAAWWLMLLGMEVRNTPRAAHPASE